MPSVTPSPLPLRSAAALRRSPTHRQQALRRRLAIGGALAGLALVSAGIGALVRPPVAVSQQPSTGPFSYFPAQ